MTTYPLATLSAQITSAGISAPSYNDILLSLQASYRAIFGADVNLDADTQDGNWLAVQAAAINAANNAVIAAYNAYSPTYAQGAGLSSLVRINGLTRDSASNSTADVDIVGVNGTTITNGVIGDNLNLGTKWDLPATVNIGASGTVTVTATSQTEGAVEAPANSLTTILTPTRGWQTVNNPAAATIGDPVESDSALRQRQALSTSLPAISPVASILAAIEHVSGVSRAHVYENDTNATDGDGIPAHSICAVVEGGDSQTIADTIWEKKTPGTGTYGSTTEAVVDPNTGDSTDINFQRLSNQRIVVEVDITALTGWLTSTEDDISANLADYVNGLDIGEDVNNVNLVVAAMLYNGALSTTFKVTEVRAAIYPAAPGTGDITIDFDEAAALAVADISYTVV